MQVYMHDAWQQLQSIDATHVAEPHPVTAQACMKLHDVPYTPSHYIHCFCSISNTGVAGHATAIHDREY